MDTRCSFNGVSFNLEMYEEPFEIKGKGWVHTAKLIGGYDRDSVGKALRGQKLWNQEILGVESWAKSYLSDGTPIGILTKERMWNGKN